MKKGLKKNTFIRILFVQKMGAVFHHLCSVVCEVYLVLSESEIHDISVFIITEGGEEEILSLQCHSNTQEIKV